tara:strand:+ start:409 stop:660 length:252 start_codon:yes stop_codon:yes gene_type:complete
MDPEVKIKLDSLEEKINDLDDKLSDILILLERDIKPNCNKMSSHIDFVDNVYDTVKNPLGFICSRVGKLSSNESHSLTDKELT